MSRLHERLRVASQEFVRCIQEIVRDELLREFGGEPSERTRESPAHPKQTGARRDGTPEAQITAFIEGHPGAMPKAVVAALGLSRKVVFKTLARACATGSIEKTGRGAGVRYSVKSIKSRPLKPVSEQDAPVRAEEEGGSSSVAATHEIKKPPRALAPSPLQPSDALISVSASSNCSPAETLLRELEATLASDAHPARLFASLQAIVADIRQAKLGVLPEDISRSLDDAIRKITAIRAEKKLPFLVGLRRDAEADWGAMGLKWRARATSLVSDLEAPPTVEAEPRGPHVSEPSPTSKTLLRRRRHPEPSL
jgi:hypothetical protein